jgi:GDP/UDP-N,N'-diacetylbacillosamine 2-epimerase (hydrolysing)
MHLLPSYGLSIQEIKDDGFESLEEIYMSLEGHNHFTMTKSLGVFLSSFVDVLGRTKPDWLILAGDRGEQLMGAVAGGYTYTPIAHIQAGELSGNIDGHARHAIGKMSHLHFASNKDAAERLRKLGEEEFRIHMVGAPQLDELAQGLYTSKAELEEKYSLNLSKPYLLIMQHSVTEEYDQAASQIEATAQAVNQLDVLKIWIFPNNDAGSEAIRKGIYLNKKGSTHVFANLKREDYLGFLKNAACIVGNSSSGIIEAPTFQVPAVNLGRRQANRIQGGNVTNASYVVVEIVKAIEKACLVEFKNSLKGLANPYGDGFSSARILEVLKTTKKDTRLLCKQLTY